MIARTRARSRQLRGALAEFLREESASAIVLVAATVGALVWANSPASASYGDTWHRVLQIGPDSWHLDLTLSQWAADALMALFFFVVGLEIKREILTGDLRDPRVALVPVLAACGGVIVPIALFTLIIASGPGSNGWAIPMATDIAFAQGALLLAGSRVATSARPFLLTLAIVDDILAIVVIALFYGKDADPAWLGVALIGLGLVAVGHRVRVPPALVTAVLGVVIWYAALRGGIHPTIAAVALGLLYPLKDARGRDLLEKALHHLHPWSAFAVVPIFALSHAGVALSSDSLQAMASSRLTWAIIAGLVVGKPLGVLLGSWVALRAGGKVADDIDPANLVIIGAFAGIGFTVALFITPLAVNGELVHEAVGGVLFGSLISSGVAAVLAVTRSRVVNE